MIPPGFDWYAVAYVLHGCANKPTDTIVIETHSLISMKCVVEVGADSLSIKDIVRLVRHDADKKEKLKQIVLRSDIDAAEKLKLASALLSE